MKRRSRPLFNFLAMYELLADDNIIVRIVS